MNTEEIKHVIKSQREEIEEVFQRERIVERDINTEELKKYLTHPNVLAILGVRRCGKSIFSCLMLRNENYGYVNFFDERFIGLRAEELTHVLQACYELHGDIDYIVLDEIQNVPGWERFVSRIRTSKRVIITGSNSQLLSGELSTFLTGRHIDFVLFPFNFREYLRWHSINIEENWEYSEKKVAEVKSALEHYLYTGGYPEVYTFGKKILGTIYMDIIEHDVVRRYAIKKPSALRNLARYILSNFSNEITYSKLKGITGLRDIHTVSRYLTYLCNAYLFFILERFSYKLKEQILAPKKVYCIDSGLINALSFSTSRNLGRMIENLVFIELMRRKHYRNMDMEVYYWRDYQHKEVDFVIKVGNRVVQLIQVTDASGIDEVERREIDALIKAGELLDCSEMLILTWDVEDTLKKGGHTIQLLPLWKWLLM